MIEDEDARRWAAGALTNHDGIRDEHESREDFLAWREFELSGTKIWLPGDPWPPGWDPSKETP